MAATLSSRLFKNSPRASAGAAMVAGTCRQMPYAST
jgi:hypothetical protein